MAPKKKPNPFAKKSGDMPMKGKKMTPAQMKKMRSMK